MKREKNYLQFFIGVAISIFQDMNVIDLMKIDINIKYACLSKQ